MDEKDKSSNKILISIIKIIRSTEPVVKEKAGAVLPPRKKSLMTWNEKGASD